MKLVPAANALILLFLGSCSLGQKGQLEKHPCDRICQKDDLPKTCHYDFHLQLYNSLGKACYNCPENATDCFRPNCVSGDGYPKSVLATNRLMPGPPVAVCQGDTIIVDLHNELSTETTTLHFHGEHFANNNYMDGFPFISQCPIVPMTKFQYRFSANVPGSLLYHSHTAHQRGDGFVGPYIVRQSEDLNPHHAMYDEDLTEHYITIQNWFHRDTKDAFSLLHWSSGTDEPENILINGRGRIFPDSPVASTSKSLSKMPLATFKVTKGKRYRFRVVNAGIVDCPVKISIEGHNVTVIASDGGNVVPTEVGSFVISEAERYDFVLNADQPVGAYLMRFGGLLDCEGFKARSAAFLIYNGFPIDDTTQATQDVMEPYESFVNGDNLLPTLSEPNYAPYEDKDVLPGYMTLASLKYCVGDGCSGSAADHPALQEGKVDKKFYLAFDMYPRGAPFYYDEEHYAYGDVLDKFLFQQPLINDIAFKIGSSPMLLPGYNKSLLCNEESLRAKGIDCKKEWCECTHLIKVDLGDIVELVLIDEGFGKDISHPFHLHGNSFFVVAMERRGNVSKSIIAGKKDGRAIHRSEVEELDKAGKIKRNLNNPPLKDTVTVPDGGFTIVRFKADNFGYWPLHCHVAWHNFIGMALVLQVGEVENLVQPPPKGFPTCGDFSF